MPAFDPSQLAVLADLLGAPVPAAYLDFMAVYPPDLAASKYKGLDRGIAAHELYVDPAKVVAENLDVRKVPVWGADAEDDWPAGHLVIGMDLSGDVIFLDVAGGDTRVHRYLCETGETIDVAPDVATYATMLATDDPTLRKS
jgi:hypothetical protein